MGLRETIGILRDYAEMKSLGKKIPSFFKPPDGVFQTVLATQSLAFVNLAYIDFWIVSIPQQRGCFWHTAHKLLAYLERHFALHGVGGGHS
jgi:hypothetical protein